MTTRTVTTTRTRMADLRHHGDAEIRDARTPVRIDFAVNVRVPEPPQWLRERLIAGIADLAAYPDAREATAAVAARHRRGPDEVLLTSGAAEAFVLLARTLTPRRAVVVHPQFTEPEAALRAAGHEVERVILRAEDGFRLDPDVIPQDADLVVVGNPTNPTSVLHPAETLAKLVRPGRIVVVDEAFIDAVPGEAETLAAHPEVVVIRSLTKTWGLAGLRVGYVLGPAEFIRSLKEAQPLWSVSSLGLIAALACCEQRAVEEAEALAVQSGHDREYLVCRLGEIPGITVTASPASPAGPFVLVRVRGAAHVRSALGAHGIAVRRGDTFPGLDGDWLRIAVRDRAATDELIAAWYAVTGRIPSDHGHSMT
jgi:histidinol-phosphate aminotransferase